MIIRSPSEQNESVQQGFSLVEVLAVIMIASTLLVSMMSILVMSQRSFQEFSDADERASKRFFFEQQFEAFAGALETVPHPEIEGTCELSGDKDGFSGCFYDIFDGFGGMRAFELEIESTDLGSVVWLKYNEQEIPWFATETKLSITYQNIGGEDQETWPVEDSQPTPAALLDEPIPPSAIVLQFAATGPIPETRRLFVTKHR
ncbi:MAG: PilW family protein [Henriciella sp.]